MKTTLILAALVSFAAAGEHPEHPMGPAKTSTEKKDAPKPEMGSKEWLKQMRKEYTAAVEKKVADAAAAGGFQVKDEKLAKDWTLKLSRVHKDRIIGLGGSSFFACADFKSAEKGSKDKVDLDFYATKNGDSWTIDKVLVHKVNGVERYKYNEKNEMVPVK